MRGNVKAAMSAAGAKSADLWQVPPGQIRILPGFNVRVDSPDYQQHIEELAESIQVNGYYQDKPLTGYVSREADGEHIYLTDGHTRFAAVQRLLDRGIQIERLPIIIKPAGTSREDMTVSLVRGNAGRPLTPYETGIVCKRLHGYGMDLPTIAARLGLSKTYVNNLLELVAAPRQVRDMVVAGHVSATTAVQTIRAHGAAAVDVLQTELAQAQAEGKTKITPRAIAKRGRRAAALAPATTAADTAARVMPLIPRLCDAWAQFDGNARAAVENMAALAQVLDEISEAAGCASCTATAG
ncbi:ParB/RepB/Spo0J family partition protein [Verticiella sediminum]|uniref:ParB/RepB/Spo0J family partition protein n=1 Tax=Verticiella sediminum TaxID=1247510 RepID=UPI001478C547|nr:ParB/RepB/Spo0J family partition protein [Verticiella sediminum]